MKAIILVTLLLVAFASASIYNIVPGEPLKREIAPRDACSSNPCGTGETCCIISGGYGCCPATNACCCPDQAHCCPNGKCTCTGTCPGSSCQCNSCGETGQCESALAF